MGEGKPFLSEDDLAARIRRDVVEIL